MNNSFNTFCFDQALMKNATDAMKDSRIPDFLSSVRPLTFMVVLQSVKLIFFSKFLIVYFVFILFVAA